VAERIAIDSYSEIIRYLGTNDPTSRVLEEILAKEEEHADDMKTLIETLAGIEDSNKSVTAKTDPRLREAS
jgi:bacterioferritin